MQKSKRIFYNGVNICDEPYQFIWLIHFSWRLDINPVLAKDEGLYECQVNTRDKMSLVFKLNVARKYINNFKCKFLCALYNWHYEPRERNRKFLNKFVLGIIATPFWESTHYHKFIFVVWRFNCLSLRKFVIHLYILHTKMNEYA